MKRLVPFILALGLAALTGPLSLAATEPTTGGYRLRSEDVVEITVLGHMQLDKTVTILPDGTITYPRIGTIQAAGKSTQELQALLYRELDKYYNNLNITVTVKSLRTDRVTVR